MSDRVQRFNPETGEYILIDVATGAVLQVRAGTREPGKPLGSPFPDVEEIEPIERTRVRLQPTDPLSDYR